MTTMRPAETYGSDTVLVIGGPEPFRETVMASLARFAYQHCSIESCEELKTVPVECRVQIRHILMLEDFPAPPSGDTIGLDDPRAHFIGANMLREGVTIYGIRWEQDDPLPTGLEPARYVPLTGFQAQDMGSTLAFVEQKLL